MGSAPKSLKAPQPQPNTGTARCTGDASRLGHQLHGMDSWPVVEAPRAQAPEGSGKAHLAYSKRRTFEKRTPMIQKAASTPRPKASALTKAFSDAHTADDSAAAMSCAASLRQ